MLGLLLDVVRIISTDNDIFKKQWSQTSGTHHDRGQTRAERVEKLASLKRTKIDDLKHKGINELNNFGRTGSIYYAPPWKRSETNIDGKEGHKIMYSAYRWKGGIKGDMGMSPTPDKTFIFSLPSGITDGVSTEWDDESSAMKRIISSMFGDRDNKDEGIMARISEEKDRVIEGIGMSFKKGKASFAWQDFYFKSVSKREFSFSHKMTPDNEEQSKAMKDIVNWIQYFASPEPLKGSNTVLRSPAQWDIHFLSNGTDNPFLPRINRCILESVSINNTPNDSFQPSENNYPNDVEIELSFKEIHIRTGSDIEKNSLYTR